MQVHDARDAAKAEAEGAVAAQLTKAADAERELGESRATVTRLRQELQAAQVCVCVCVSVCVSVCVRECVCVY